MSAPGPGPGEEAPGAREAARRDPLAADLRCSLFAAALQSYKRDSALRPFPGRYASGDRKDFEGLVSTGGRPGAAARSARAPPPMGEHGGGGAGSRIKQDEGFIQSRNPGLKEYLGF